MVYDMWKFDDSMDMIKQTYVTGSPWNNKIKIDKRIPVRMDWDIF